MVILREKSLSHVDKIPGRQIFLQTYSGTQIPPDGSRCRRRTRKAAESSGWGRTGLARHRKHVPDQATGYDMQMFLWKDTYKVTKM